MQPSQDKSTTLVRFQYESAMTYPSPSDILPQDSSKEMSDNDNDDDEMSDTPSTPLKLGRPKGYTGKRKPAAELSKNPHSIKRQKRVDEIRANEVRLKIERAKNADRSARGYALEKVKKTKEYQDASEKAKERMEEETRSNVMRKRDIQGISAAATAKKLGYGEEGGAYAEWDDGNSAWEDMELDPHDPFTEVIWRRDDNENGDDPDYSKIKDDIRGQGAQIQHNLGSELVKIAFRRWRRTWRNHITSFHQKTLALERRPFEIWERGHIHVGRYYDVLPPHIVFTIGEKAVFKNMIAWTVTDDCGGWYDLPGPAEWWPDNYDFGKYGWEPPNEDLAQEFAFALALGTGDEVPEEWDQVLPTEEELGLIGSSIASKLLGEWF